MVVEKLDVDSRVIFENLDVLSGRGTLSLIASVARVEERKQKCRELEQLTEDEIVKENDKGLSFTERGRKIYEVIKEVKGWNKSGLKDIESVTVLVGNEDPDAQDLYRRQLAEAEVEFAETTDELLDDLGEVDVDVIITERIMRDMESFVGRIRSESDIPVIAVTGMKSEKSILDLGLDDYMVKPVGADALRRAVGRSVRARHLPLRYRQLLFLLAQKAELEEQYNRERLKGNKHYRKTVEDFKAVSEEIMENH